MESTNILSINWYNSGIIRSRVRLENALGNILALREKAAVIGAEDPIDLMKRMEFQNMLLVSEMVIRAALVRKESRGAHYRNDYPQESLKWQSNIMFRKQNDEIQLEAIDSASRNQGDRKTLSILWLHKPDEREKLKD
jgi:succinate dehydrogenase/fumarate reductase flavoprotein subunit